MKKIFSMSHFTTLTQTISVTLADEDDERDKLII